MGKASRKNKKELSFTSSTKEVGVIQYELSMLSLKKMQGQK